MVLGSPLTLREGNISNMPYITSEDKALARINVIKPGELNFLITDLINDYLNNKGLSYGTINDVLGALKGSKLEFYRRVAVPYEEQKRVNNGDVYNPEFVKE